MWICMRVCWLLWTWTIRGCFRRSVRPGAFFMAACAHQSLVIAAVPRRRRRMQIKCVRAQDPRPVWERNLLVHRPTSILHISHFETERAFVILSSRAKRHRAECDTSSTQEFLMFLDDNSATGRKNWCYRCKFNSIRCSQIRLMRRRSFSHTCSTSQLMMAKLYKNHHKVGFLRRGGITYNSSCFEINPRLELLMLLVLSAQRLVLLLVIHVEQGGCGIFHN